jgi:hypothetical protein
MIPIAVLAAGCQPSTQLPEAPWLHGLTDAVASDQGSPETMRRLGDFQDLEPGCGADAYRGIELVADVAPAPGRERIVASHAQGVFVYDTEDQLVAWSPGYRCDGSADAIEALAAGDAYGHRTIVVVGTSGGHTEHDTWVGLFRIGSDARLEPAFAADVEHHRGDEVSRGLIALLPSSLVYVTPEGGAALYVYDPVARAYLVPRDPADDPPHQPPVVTRR